MQNIAKALATFHKEMSPVVKDKTNPHFKNRYATIDAILEAIKEPMSKAGLTFIQVPQGVDELKTIIIHVESGESIESTVKIFLAKSDAQAYGSALTYQRRYSLSAMLGIATEEDDDGEKATPQPTQKICVECKKPHSGPYPKCLSCYNNAKPNTSGNAPTSK